MNSSLTVKFVAFFSAVFLLVIALTVWLSYFIYHNRWEREMNRTNMALLQQIQEKVELVLKQVDRHTIMFMQEPELNRYMENYYAEPDNKYVNYTILNDKMQTLLSSNPYISSIYVYSRITDTVLTEKMEETSGRFYDRDWMSDLDRMNGYYRWLTARAVTEPGSAFPIQRNVVSLLRSYPLIGSPDFRKGAVIVNIDEKVLFDLIESVDRERVGQTFIVDRDGRIISHENKELLYKRIGEAAGIPAEALTETGGWFAHDDLHATVYHLTSPYTGWQYVSVIPQVELSRQMTLTRNVLILIAAGMFLFALFLVFAVGRYKVNPFDRFHRSMSALLNKHHKAHLGEPSVSVLHKLEQTFTQVLSDNESMQRRIRESIPAMRWRMVMDILFGYETSYAKLKPVLETLNLQLAPSHYTVMIIEYDHIQDTASPRDIALYSYALCNVTEELIAGACTGTAIELEKARVVAILSFGGDDAGTNQMKVFQVADLIRNYVKQHFRKTVTVGIGGHYTSLSGVSASYKEAAEAIGYKLLLGGDTVVSLEDLASYHYGEYLKFFDMTDRIAESVAMADEPKTAKQVDTLFAEAVEKSVPPDLVRQLCFQMLLKSMRAVSDKEDNLRQMFNPIPNFYVDIQSFNSVKEMKRYTEDMLGIMIRHIRERRAAAGRNETVANILRYLDGNYSRHDLSLNDLASRFNLSVPYISKLFKDHTQINFMDYLIRIRMEKAKELLADTDKKIAEVAEEVGYANIHSFIRIFKKYTGCTPGDYRDYMRWKRLEDEHPADGF